MKTFVAKPAEVVKKWIVIDADGLVVGRLAALVALRLKGKHKAIYTPHVDCGDNIIVVNAEKAVFTGRKYEDKVYNWHTGYPGGLRTARQISRAISRARRRKGRLAHVARWPPQRQLMRNLKVYKGPEHPHVAQNPEKLNMAELTARIRGPNSHGIGNQNPRRSRQPEAGRDFQRCAGAPVHVQKLDKLGRAYATGKRKNAVARVWIKPGKGQITVNAKDYKAYFARPVLQMLLQQPLSTSNRTDQYDINVTVMGGGLSGSGRCRPSWHLQGAHAL